MSAGLEIVQFCVSSCAYNEYDINEFCVKEAVIPCFCVDVCVFKDVYVDGCLKKCVINIVDRVAIVLTTNPFF